MKPIGHWDKSRVWTGTAHHPLFLFLWEPHWCDNSWTGCCSDVLQDGSQYPRYLPSNVTKRFSMTALAVVDMSHYNIFTWWTGMWDEALYVPTQNKKGKNSASNHVLATEHNYYKYHYTVYAAAGSKCTVVLYMLMVGTSPIIIDGIYWHPCIANINDRCQRIVLTVL